MEQLTRDQLMLARLQAAYNTLIALAPNENREVTSAFSEFLDHRQALEPEERYVCSALLNLINSQEDEDAKA